MSVEKIKRECPGLPPGWQREEVVRKSGLSVGKTDVYYYSPDGRRARSKPQIARILGDAFDLSAFDFRTGKIIHSALRKARRLKNSSYDYTRGIRHDTSFVLPIRQTASIFKQPVTEVRTRPESKAKTDLKHGPQEQPKQLFWEKRLQGLHACDVMEEALKTMDLPRNIQGAGPNLSNENLLQSIASALHLSNQPLKGQNASKKAIHKNPGVSINTDQPLIQAVAVTDDDIKRQEAKVQEARRKLEQAMGIQVLR